MNPTDQFARFKVLTQIEGPWNRLKNREGTSKDLSAVTAYLAKIWSYDPADPRAFEDWIARSATEQDNRLPRSEKRKRFEAEEFAKTAETKVLIEGVAQTQYAADFFNSLAAFSTDLRLIVYKTAVAACHNEGLLVALSLLSQERLDLIQKVNVDPRSSPVMNTFGEYLNGVRIPLALKERPSESVLPTGPLLDRLFQLATTPLTRLKSILRELRPTQVQDLVRLATKIINIVPDRGFGTFVKLNLATLVCLADSSNQHVDNAKRILLATNYPEVANILINVAPESVLSIIKEWREPIGSERDRLLAALIDGLRESSDQQPEVEAILKPFLSKRSSVVALAARAALLRKYPKRKTTFERLLLRQLDADDRGFVREWLIRNPEYVGNLHLDRASLLALRKLLDRSRRNSASSALWLADKVLQYTSGPELLQRWQLAIGTLQAIHGDSAQTVFVDFVLRQLQADNSEPLLQLLQTDPAIALYRSSFNSILERCKDIGMWDALFTAYQGRTAPSELTQVVLQFYERPQMSHWVVTHLVPSLLEHGWLSPQFHRQTQNATFLSALGQQLSENVLSITKSIREFALHWETQKNASKQRLFAKVQSGLNMALSNATEASFLPAKLDRVQAHLRAWVSSDSPRLDPSLAAFANAELPSAIEPSRTTLEQVFRIASPNKYHVCLFAAANPWIFRTIFADSPGSWPSGPMLVDQMIGAFLEILTLKGRADDSRRQLGGQMGIELAVAIREIIAEIEADLAGYFIFRDVLAEAGLGPVMPKLGEVVHQKDLSSRLHKVLRAPNQPGRLRVFTLGISVEDKVVSSATVAPSGTTDDRD